jgi:HK97 family phage prohead protease
VADNKPYGDVKYADPKNGRYPVDTAAHAKAAWAYINMPKNAAQYPMNGVTLSEVKDRIMAACKKFGIEISAGSSSRGEDLAFTRSYPLKEVAVTDGRIVEAYAAVFETPTPISDTDGQYIEVIDPAAFNRILPKLAPQGERKQWRCGVFYNHGMTIHGSPSSEYSMPIGVPLEIKADDRGLYTRTEYLAGELADLVLDRIKAGSLPGYSFSGRFHRSRPAKPRGGYFPGAGGNLPVVRRTESTLREYGPTPFPYYPEAVITAVRADLLTEQLDQVREALRSGTPVEDLPSADDAGTPSSWGLPSGGSPEGRPARSVKEKIDAQRADFLLRHRR